MSSLPLCVLESGLNVSVSTIEVFYILDFTFECKIDDCLNSEITHL